MSLKHLNQAFDAPIKKSSQKFILVALADYANETGEAYPSTETICNKTSLDRKTVLSGLTKLSELGFINDTGARKGKTGQIKVWLLTITNSAENGTLKESQKRNSPKNGTVPFLREKDAENGTLKESQKRDIEPSVLLTTSEPPERKTRAKKFTPPTEIEITGFAKKENLNLEGFFDYYESNGWMVGRNKMKNWQAASRNWNKRQSQFGSKRTVSREEAVSKQNKKNMAIAKEMILARSASNG